MNATRLKLSLLAVTAMSLACLWTDTASAQYSRHVVKDYCGPRRSWHREVTVQHPSWFGNGLLLDFIGGVIQKPGDGENADEGGGDDTDDPFKGKAKSESMTLTAENSELIAVINEAEGLLQETAHLVTNATPDPLSPSAENPPPAPPMGKPQSARQTDSKTLAPSTNSGEFTNSFASGQPSKPAMGMARTHSLSLSKSAVESQSFSEWSSSYAQSQSEANDLLRRTAKLLNYECTTPKATTSSEGGSTPIEGK